MTPKITWLHTAAAQVQAWDWALSHRSCESLSVTWSMIALSKIVGHHVPMVSFLLVSFIRNHHGLN